MSHKTQYRPVILFRARKDLKQTGKNLVYTQSKQRSPFPQLIYKFRYSVAPLAQCDATPPPIKAPRKTCLKIFFFRPNTSRTPTGRRHDRLYRAHRTYSTHTRSRQNTLRCAATTNKNSLVIPVNDPHPPPPVTHRHPHKPPSRTNPRQELKTEEQHLIFTARIVHSSTTCSF